MALPDLMKVAISMLLIGPLAFCMGMPFHWAFPCGEVMPALFRGFGESTAALLYERRLATILAIHFGFNAVIGAAAILYGVAAVAYWRPPA